MKRILIILGFVIMSFSDDKPIKKEIVGIASYYANMFEGRRTATGEIFRQKEFTAASNFYPLHTIVKVTNLDNGDTIVVRVNDRMAVWTQRIGRVIDLSRAGADSLKYRAKGLQRVSVIEFDSVRHIETPEKVLKDKNLQ